MFSTTGFPYRVYYQTKTLYNILFHAQESYDKAIALLKKDYSDDFSTVLKLEYIEPFDTLKKYMGRTNQVASLLKTSIKKSTKVIQKYSIKKKGVEYNNLIDDTYILLGKSHYYLKQYSSAIEVFNYVKDNFKGTDMYNDAVLWSARCNLRLSNEYLMEEEVKSLYENIIILDKDIKVKVLEVYTQLLINLQKEKEAIPILIQLIDNTKDNLLKSRYSFILAQLYQSQENYIQSNEYFDKVIEQDATNDFVVYSKINRINNQIKDKVLYQIYLKDIKQILKDRRFKNYHAFINYNLGKVYLKSKDITKAKVFFIKSTKNKLAKKTLKTICFEQLGNIYFNLGDYSKARESYTNCLANAPKGWNRKNIISRKIDNLKEVVLYLKLCRQKDSLLTLFKMDKNDKLKYLKKIQDRKRNPKKVIVEEFSEENTLTQNNRGMSTFYFYNLKSIKYGKAEFLKIWGNRILQDNWRTIFTQRVDRIEENNQFVVDNNNIVKEDSTLQLGDITKDPNEISEFEKERNQAYYRLATIYKNKYNEYDLAIKRFEKLLSFNPSKPIMIPTFYNLYVIYSQLNNIKKANYFRKRVLNLAPNSKYADFVNNIKSNRSETIKDDSSRIEQKYAQVYKLYKDGKYIKVVDECERMIDSLFEETIIPKLYLLKAMALGWMQNVKGYKNILNKIIKEYPKSDESYKAKKIISRLNAQK